ncbi:MAG: type II/IV secretion system ATPase subunit [Chloroflexota bacterium]|nr:type II/IV secretion system ATPase subunit [Chloroflexota bacterium]
MPRTVVPFGKNDDAGNARRMPDESDELFLLLPEEMQTASQKYKHLWEYLCQVPLDEVAVPEYVSKLKRSDGDRKQLNLIFPVGEEIFIHMYSDSSGGRPFYIPIEPGMNQDMSVVLHEVEDRLVDEAEALSNVKSDEERTECLLRLIDKVTTVHRNGTSTSLSTADDDGSGKGDKGKGKGKKGKGISKKSKVEVSPDQLEALKYIIVRDKVGMGVMEPLIQDSNIEDISCSGVGGIFVEHKIFRSVQSCITFETHDDVDEFVLRLSESIKKPVTLRSPIVDATLADGSRINIVFGREVSRRGSNFTIRKFADTPLSVMELIEFGSLNYEMAAYLSMVIEDGMNVFVVGETASGKTTLMNAVTAFMPTNHKIISIEDTPELQVPHSNWLREVAKNPAPGEKVSNVNMFELLKAALRQRPDVIIVGEIRGEEGNIAFGAMQTGHQVMSTFHASNVEKLIQRLTGPPINVSKTYMDNLNVVVCQNAVKLPNGKKGRRATSISEIVGYDPVDNIFSFVEVFRWDSVNDTFEFVGNKNSFLLEEKLAPKHGIPSNRKWQIYSSVERRQRILEKLHKDKGVTDFYELLKVLAKARQEGLF